MLKNYSDQKTFKEIKNNYINFEIKDYKKVYEGKDMEKEIMTSDVLSGLDTFIIKIKVDDYKSTFGSITLYIAFSNENPYIEIYTYYSDKYKFELDFVFDLSKFNDLESIDNSIVYCWDKSILSMSKFYLDIALKSLYYIKEKMINRKVEYKQIEGNKKVNEVGSNATINKPTKKKIEVIGDRKTIYFTMNNVTNEQLRLFKKSYNRYTDSWFVLPHTRRYRNGKVVQVKGYYKGDKKGSKANKTYIVE